MGSIVILILGRGSNMQTIVNASIPNIRIAVVLNNSTAAVGLARTAEHGIPTDSLNHKDFTFRNAFDRTIMKRIGAYQPDLVVLVGFTRILIPEFCTRYEGRPMSIHPSILPSFTGLHTHERTLAAGCRVAGCTIHFVAPELGCGSIISQGAVPTFDNDVADDIAARVLKVGHRLFPQAVADLAASRLKVEGNRAINGRSQPEDRPLLA